MLKFTQLSPNKSMFGLLFQRGNKGLGVFYSIVLIIVINILLRAYKENGLFMTVYGIVLATLFLGTGAQYCFLEPSKGKPNKFERFLSPALSFKDSKRLILVASAIVFASFVLIALFAPK